MDTLLAIIFLVGIPLFTHFILGILIIDDSLKINPYALPEEKDP